MAGNTVEKEGLPAAIRQQVGCPGQLLDCAAGSFHRHNQPVHTRFVDDFRLFDVFGVVAIDRRQRDDRLDPLS
jgi:hypothetical protein